MLKFMINLIICSFLSSFSYCAQYDDDKHRAQLINIPEYRNFDWYWQNLEYSFLDLSEKNRRFMRAAEKEDATQVQLLIANGAQINYQNINGMTALMIASRKPSLPIVHILNRAKVNLNIQDKIGNTALMHAAEKGYSVMMNAILSAGADVKLLNIFDENALHLAWYNAFFNSLSDDKRIIPNSENYIETLAILVKAIGLKKQLPMSIQELFSGKEIPKVLVMLIFEYLKTSFE